MQGSDEQYVGVARQINKSTAVDGITVNAISPGTIMNPKLKAAFGKMATAEGWADKEASWPVIERTALR